MKYIPPLGSTDPDAGYQNRTGGTPGTPVDAAAIEHPQREIVEVIKQAGLVPDDANLGQLHEAIVVMGKEYAPTTRTLNTTAPLSGGGSLDADLNLSITPGPEGTTLVSRAGAAVWDYPLAAPVLVHAVTQAGTTSWLVPDRHGDGTPWLCMLRIKGAGAGGGGSQLSGTRIGGHGGGEGCTVICHITMRPGDVHALTVGAGGKAGAAGGLAATAGGTTSFGTLTVAPGATGVLGGRKARTDGEVVINGACGETSTQGYIANCSVLGGCGGGPGGQANTTGSLAVDGCGGAGGHFNQNGVDTAGGPGADGYVEIYSVYSV